MFFRKFLPLHFAFLMAVFFVSEKKTIAQSALEGEYLAKLDIGDAVVPFFLRLSQNEGQWRAEIINGEEILDYDEVYVEGDKMTMVMGIFDAEIQAELGSDGRLKGHFVKNNVSGYSIPFYAERGSTQRFATSEEATYDFSGRWKTSFTNPAGNSTDAIGLFEQDGNILRGTFLTKLGDYRFLEGNVEGQSFYLSTFNGSHVYFFEGHLTEAGELQGRFRSGPRHLESFVAVRDETFELPDAYSLTYLKPGFDRFTFTFPDLEGNLVSLDDEIYRDKVVLVQLFGSWCPNCMDETRFLADWYRKNKNRGVEVIALSFETRADFEYASSRVKKAKERLGADYAFLIAGESNKEKASEALPALNQVLAFPTLIYLDRKGQVAKIHTGFNGPGTGELYLQWIEAHEKLVDALLAAD